MYLILTGQFVDSLESLDRFYRYFDFEIRTVMLALHLPSSLRYLTRSAGSDSILFLCPVFWIHHSIAPAPK